LITFGRAGLYSVMPGKFIRIQSGAQWISHVKRVSPSEFLTPIVMPNSIIGAWAHSR
jgi:hypothetical protein